MITSFNQINLPQNRISGVVFKELKTFSDGRGYFQEIIRKTDSFFAEGFAQWSHSFMQKNTVKAWHFHHLQVDWWYACCGVLHSVLYDNRPESSTYQRKIEFLMGEDSEDASVLSVVVKIPQGVLHGCKVISSSAHLFYITSQIYDPQDEGRLPFNTQMVSHHWGEETELILSEKDRQVFIPPYERIV